MAGAASLACLSNTVPQYSQCAPLTGAPQLGQLLIRPPHTSLALICRIVVLLRLVVWIIHNVSLYVKR